MSENRNPPAFISYRSEDRKDVVPIVEFLRGSCGVATRALNWHDVKAGHTHQVITDEIRKCSLLVAVVTKDNAYQNKETKQFKTSPYIIQEIGIACALEKEVVILIEKCVDKNELAMVKDLTYVEFERERLLECLAKRAAANGQNEPSSAIDTLEELQMDVDVLDLIQRLVLSAKDRFLKRLPVIAEYQVVPPKKEKRLPRTLIVRELADVGYWMNDQTFHMGIEYLYEQITSEPNELLPDLFIGLNATGAMIASYLNGKIYGKDWRSFTSASSTGYRADGNRIFTIDSFRNPDGLSACLEARQTKLKATGSVSAIKVLLVDGQVKRGESAHQFIEQLEQTFAERFKFDVYFAALVACDVNVAGQSLPTPVPMKSFFEAPINQTFEAKNKMPDYLGYISPHFVKPLRGLP